MRNSCLAGILTMVLVWGLWIMLLQGCRGGDEDVEGTPLVKVGETIITKEDVDRAWMNLPENEKVKYLGRTGRETLVNNLVSLELLYREALRQNLDEEAEMKRRIEKAKQNILVDELIAKSIQPADLYRMYQDSFIRAGQIQVKVNPPDEPQADLKASREINKIYQRLKNGEDFEALAREHSEGITAARGGELGYLTKKMALDAFGFNAQQALFSLNDPGEFTAPVRETEGYSIYQLIEAPGNLDPRGFTQDLGNMLFQEKSEEIFRGYVNELKSRTQVINYDENMEAFLSLGEKKPSSQPATEQGDTVPADE
jgi:peptidyl-prolyl cis-trans isomerase C